MPWIGGLQRAHCPVVSQPSRALSLDGIRGLALGAPIAVHLGIAGAGNGLWLAIGMFFTLSGFLITTLALREIEGTGHLSTKGFYARRLRRLMPASLLVLAATVVGAVLVDWPAMRDLGEDVLAALVWMANWQQLWTGGYLAGFVPSLTAHFWSLSLEEQIYLAFPLVLVACLALRRWIRPAIAVVSVMAILTLISWIVLWTVDDVSYLYLSTWTRMGEATFGCMVAGLAHLWPNRRAQRYASGVIILLMILIAPFWVLATRENVEDIRIGITCATPMTAVVIAMLWRYPASLPARFFSLSVPAWLGRRSYGIYLIHLPLIDLMARQLDVEQLPRWGMVVAVAGTIALAGLMFRLVEEPIRLSKIAAGPQRFAGLVGAGAMVVAAMGAVAIVRYDPILNIPTTTPDAQLPPGLTLPPGVTLPSSGPSVAPSGSDVTTPTAPALSASPPVDVGSILVTGDSTAWVTAGAVRDSMGPLGWEPIEEIHMVGCPTGGDVRSKWSVAGGEVVTREAGEEPGCDQWWNELLPLWLAAVQPKMVLFVGGYGLAYPIDPAGDDQWCQLGDGSGRCEEWVAERLRMTSERIHAYAPGAHVVWATPGHVDPWGPFDIPAVSIDSLDTLIRAEAARDAASVIDLGAWLDDHMDLTVDGTHIGPEGVRALTPWMGVELPAAAAGERLAG